MTDVYVLNQLLAKIERLQAEIVELKAAAGQQPLIDLTEAGAPRDAPSALETSRD